MASAQLNFNEATLDTSSALYELYTRLYNGMVAASQVTPPDLTSNPPTKENGEVDKDAITSSLREYSTILMKNSAYLFAHSIVESIDAGGSGSGDGGGAGLGYVSRAGDSMTGRLLALHGFQAGQDGKAIFEVSIESDEQYADVYGSLRISKNLKADGDLTLGASSAISFGSSKTIFIDSEDGKLHIDNGNVIIGGELVVDSIAIKGIVINENGIYRNDKEYYYAGNSNLSSVDWAMKAGHVYDTLQVDKDATFGGSLNALNGFSLGIDKAAILYSEVTEDDVQQVRLSADLDITAGKGIKYRGVYVIRRFADDDSAVSFCAPGRIMYLGGNAGVGDVTTQKIILQSDIYHSINPYIILSKDGAGDFRTGFKAGILQNILIEAYHDSESDQGILVHENLRFGIASEGPGIRAEGNVLVLDGIYTYLDENSVPIKNRLPITIGFVETTSLFRDLSLEWSATANFNTEAEFFRFNKPVESESFSIKSEKYKTRLIENTLFLNDGVWLEGVLDGMSIHGNAYFSGSLSSTTFASGFAGYGWAINQSALYGGYEATFDNLTVRKKMRVYELEVQKTSVTNGSLWVSDSCSGDIVEELI